MFRFFLNKAQYLLVKLIGPHVTIERPEEQRQARLISAVLLVMTYTSVSGAIYTPEDFVLVRLLLAYVSGPVFLCYLLSRTRHYLLAASVAMPLLMITPYAGLISRTEFSGAIVAESVIWIALPMFVSVITLPLRYSSVFLLSNIVMLASMPVWVKGMESEYLPNGLSFIVFTSVLLLVIASLRQRDVVELQEKSDTLQQKKQQLEREIQERNQAQAELGHMQHLINSVNEAVLLISNSGEIKRVNKTCLHMFAYNENALVGKQIDLLIDLSSEAKRNEICAALEQSQKGEGIWHSFEAKRSDEQCFPAEIFVSQIELHGSNEYVVTLRDVSEYRRVEKLKDEFVSSVSHELRTPLTSVQGALGLIGGMYRSELSEKVEGLFDIAFNNSSSLSSLVDDILDISKLESGNMAMNYELVRVAPMLEDLIRECEPLAKTYSATCRLIGSDTTLEIETDKLRLAQVIRNLISNALKHAPANSEVEIQYAGDKDKLSIYVIDHGSGIPEEEQDKIFEKFYQAQSTSKQQRNGTGLGLSISQRLVQQMGGEIAVESRPGYTCFTIDVPLKQAEQKK